jgi:hypothetical protein
MWLKLRRGQPGQNSEMLSQKKKKKKKKKKKAKMVSSMFMSILSHFLNV